MMKKGMLFQMMFLFFNKNLKKVQEERCTELVIDT